MIPVEVVGLGTSPADLTPRTLAIIQEAQVLVGGKRLLGYFPDHRAEKITLGKSPENVILKLAELAQDRRVVILASGDPNFFGIGSLVVRLLGAENVHLHPNLSAVQVAAARLQIPWEEARLVSLHGRGWPALDAALNNPGRIFVYTDSVHTPGAIARRLLDLGRTQVRLCVLEDLGQETERLQWLSLAEAAARSFSSLNTVVLEQGATHSPNRQEPVGKRSATLHLGMPEEAYGPEGGLITKAEVRAVVIAKLALGPGQVLWDIGAGTGSVGLEASLLLEQGRILAVEKNPPRASRIIVNRDTFGVQNLEVICGQAPECLASLPSPDRVFIGGGGDSVTAILREARRRLQPAGKIVLTASRLETLENIRRFWHQENVLADIVQLQISRSQPLSGGIYLKALNPVWIITAAAQGQ